VHLRTLRHSTASFLLAAGTHTKVVQEHLGHSSYAITADIDSHVAPAQRREAADRLDEALEWWPLLYAAALLYRLLYSRKRRAGHSGRPASDLLFTVGLTGLMCAPLTPRQGRPVDGGPAASRLRWSVQHRVRRRPRESLLVQAALLYRLLYLTPRPRGRC
jgi:hypothetical protein